MRTTPEGALAKKLYIPVKELKFKGREAYVSTHRKFHNIAQKNQITEIRETPRNIQFPIFIGSSAWQISLEGTEKSEFIKKYSSKYKITPPISNKWQTNYVAQKTPPKIYE